MQKRVYYNEENRILGSITGSPGNDQRYHSAIGL